MFDKKVLICCPTSVHKSYVGDTWIKSVKEIDYPNKEYFLCDNSINSNFSRLLNKKGITTKWVNPKNKHIFQILAESHEECRKKALEIGAEWMLHLEYDIEPPKEILKLLLMRKKKVIGGLYHIYNDDKRVLCFQKTGQMDSDYTNANNLLSGDDNFEIDGETKQVYSCGLGAILIHKSVFSKINFRFDKNILVAPDSLFAFDCYNQKIPIFVDTSIICYHRNRKWNF